MKKRSSIIVILALFIASSLTFSIYEDEIVHTDWYRENIGEVQTAFFRNSDSLLVSTAESVIASLNPKSGDLNWRQVLPNNETLLSFTSNSHYAFSLSHLSSSLFLRLFDAGTGSLHWDVTLASSPVVSALLTDTQVILVSPQYIQVRSVLTGNIQWQISNKQQSKAVYGYVEESLLYVTEISGDVQVKAYQLSSGTVKEEKKLGNFGEISQVVYVKNHVVFLADKVYVHRLTSKSNTAHNTQETAKSISASQDFALLIIQGQSTQIVKVNDEKLEPVYTWKKSLPTYVSSTDAVTATSPSSFELLNLANKEIQSFSNSQLSDRGHVIRLFQFEEFTLIVHQDLTLTMVSKTLLLWQREEALSHIIDVKIMEFPSSHVFDTIVHTFDMHSNFIASFLSRVGSHLQQLTDFINGGKDAQVSSSLTKDRFGYRQLILAVTKAGKLFAISTEKGTILWHKFFPGLRIQHIFVTKSVFPLESLLIGKDSSRTLLYTFNPLTGQPITSNYRDYNVIQANMLPWEHSVMLVDEKYNVFTYPEISNTSSLFFYVVDTVETSVKGYALISAKTSNIWKIPFSEGEKIINIHYHPDEHITSPFKITGDRKALPKYLNRNMVAIATIKEQVLNIYIVDTVTGDIIYNIYHTMSCGPIHFISSENWFGYHYWNIQNSRYEYSVIELYEKEIDWKSTTFSSFSPPEVTAIQQSFVFLSGITTIGITQTLYGLSTKHLLFGLPTGQIAAISRNFLDARRPAKEQMTQELYEEGLMPYSPWMSLNKWNIINYYRKISKLREIKTAPAYLESTSLVFAYGLDNIFTLMNPSGPFDVLGVHFNYFGLVATAIGIVGLTIVFVYLSKKKDLYRRWE